MFNGISHSTKLYLTLNLSRSIQQVTSKFRFGVSDICSHYFRYRTHTDRDLLCPLCKKSKEDEVHFVLVCPVTQRIREQFIPEKFFREPCFFRLTILMSSTNENIVKNFSLFLYRAFKLRETLCS